MRSSESPGTLITIWRFTPLPWAATSLSATPREFTRWRQYVAPRVGTRDRYDAFFLHAIKTMWRHEAAVLDIPMVYVSPVGFSNDEAWNDQPGLRTVRVGGDHHLMLVAPQVAEVAEAILGATALVDGRS